MKKIIVLIILTGCSLFEQPHWDIDPDLEYWVNKFYFEAELRGKIIQKNYLTVSLSNKYMDEAGQSKKGRHLVYISSSFYYTHMIRNNSKSDSLAMEFVLFHELGHALLGNGHSDPYSIMNQCCTTYDKYTKENEVEFRKDMIDKLFR